MVTKLEIELTIYSDLNNILILSNYSLIMNNYFLILHKKVQKMRLSLLDKYKFGLKKLSITQNELALEFGYTRNYINMLINGKRKNAQFDAWMKENVLPLFENNRRIKK